MRMIIMAPLLRTFGFLALWISYYPSMAAEPYCLSDDTDPYLKFGTKTAYNLARGSFKREDLVPEGCEAKQSWHLVRHGTRYPSDGDISDFVTKLPRLQKDILEASNAGKGELCSSDVTNLRNWTLGGLNSTWESILAPEGELELFELASRYKQALPNLLGQPFSNDTFKFRHTEKQRTEASARAYAQGLFGKIGKTIYIPKPLDPDPIIKFYKLCKKYIKEVDKNPEATIEAKLFKEGPVMATVMEEASRRLGFNVTFDEVDVMYDACRFYKAWDPKGVSAWCAAFTPVNLKVMEYLEDLKYYYEDGYGHSINYECACPPLQDLIQQFRNVIENGSKMSGIFYFTHSAALLKVMSRLGLYNDTNPLRHDRFDPMRLWKTSNHGIFATNLAFTLSKCSADNRGWWISTTMSETPVQLPGCPSEKGCSWENFLQFYGQYEQCDFDAICENKISPSGSDERFKAWWSRFMQKAREFWQRLRALFEQMNSETQSNV